MKQDSRAQLEESLKQLKTDHVDLYQFHALTKMSDLDKVLGPGGAMETMEAAKKEGKIRYIGFSVHSVETAIAAIHPYPFDTVLFPVNWVLFTQANFGPQILKSAQEKNMGILALKGMAKNSMAGQAEKGSPGAKVLVSARCVPRRSRAGLRWTLNHPVTAVTSLATNATSDLPWTLHRATNRSIRPRNRPCSTPRMASTPSFIWQRRIAQAACGG